MAGLPTGLSRQLPYDYGCEDGSFFASENSAPWCNRNSDLNPGAEYRVGYARLPPRHDGPRGPRNALEAAGPLGTNGVQKRTSKKHKKKHKKSQGTGTPPLALLAAENRRRMRRHSQGNRKGRKALPAAAATPGGLFPLTPKFMLGAPTMCNETLMAARSQPTNSVRSAGGGAAGSSERGILGIDYDQTGSTSSPFEQDPDCAQTLDFFGSNDGLIVPRASPEGLSSSGSEELPEASASDEDNGNDSGYCGMKLDLGEAQGALRQRQQEMRINSQAEYITQLEDDNLLLRGRIMKMEDELDRLRQKEEEQLNLQERMYLLEEELNRLKRNGSSCQVEDEADLDFSDGGDELEAMQTGNTPAETLLAKV